MDPGAAALGNADRTFVLIARLIARLAGNVCSTGSVDVPAIVRVHSHDDDDLNTKGARSTGARRTFGNAAILEGAGPWTLRYALPAACGYGAAGTLTSTPGACVAERNARTDHVGVRDTPLDHRIFEPKEVHRVAGGIAHEVHREPRARHRALRTDRCRAERVPLDDDAIARECDRRPAR